MKFNNTHREKLSLTQFSKRFIEIEAWLLLTFFICLYDQLNSIHFNCHILKSTDVSKRLFIKETENEWLLLSASFTTKFELVFVLTQENDFFS